MLSVAMSAFQRARRPGSVIKYWSRVWQAVRFEVLHPKKRKAVIRIESEETQHDVRERRSYGDLGQEEVEEVDFVPSAFK